MESASTQELGLTRLWYLVGNWEGAGKGPDFRFRASARCAWALNDHFLVGQMEIRDAGSDRLLSIAHWYIYYNHDLNCLVADIFQHDGIVERARGP